MSENAQFKLYIQDYFEKVINDRIPDQGCDGDEELAERKEIAQITCAYENSELINLLKERGKVIGSEKWDKLDKINEKITDKIHNGKILDDA